MTGSPWAFDNAPDALESSTVTLLEGTTFFLGDRAGDAADGMTGLYVRDTRTLSRWELWLGGRRLQSLTAATEAPFVGVFVGWAPASTASGVLVVRRRSVGNGMREDIAVLNSVDEAVTVSLDLWVAADFADLFEVKEGRIVDGRSAAPAVRPDGLDFAVTRGAGEYGTRIVAGDGVLASAAGLHWTVELPGRSEWRTTIEVHTRLLGDELPLHHPSTVPVEHAAPFARRRDWYAAVPVLETGDAELARVLARSVEDLGSLRIFDPDRPALPVVAAGAPWFMALFGRDSLLTALMTLPLDDSLARGAVETLAAHQGTRYDPLSEEQPGRILHEIRFGPAGTLALGGRAAYYGTADATPLFVMLVAELARWRGPEAVGPELLASVDRALDWMRGDGDPDGDGFIEYARQHEGGLLNQGWKDSWNGVNHADGRLAEPPIALAEVQAYAYAAYLGRAGLADALGDPATAATWRDRAARLRAEFDRRFWLPDRGWYAVALDAGKRPVDALTSNAGHCLWTGIALPERAAELAAHLTSPAMSSGWGVRTLATSMAAFDPLSYHNGSVWPHDTALCAAGLARYGFREEATRIATAVLDAAPYFGHRLPELFGGYARDQVAVPVPYAAACSPQAWAAAAPIELVRTMLGLEPDGDTLRCDPLVPDRMLPLRISELVYRGRRYRLAVDVGERARIDDLGPV